MPDPTDKHILNAPGSYYNDSTCIDCDLCREIAPRIFRGDADSAASYVWSQPVSAEDLALAEEARLACPSETIGNDG